MQIKLKKISSDASFREFYRIQKNFTSTILVRSNKNKFKNLIIYAAVNKFLKDNKLEELVILDPPRDGSKNFAKYVDPKISKKVIYFSCNLASWVRDISLMTANGYKLKKVTILDMFAQTQHMEIFSVLERA